MWSKEQLLKWIDIEVRKFEREAKEENLKLTQSEILVFKNGFAKGIFFTIQKMLESEGNEN